MEIFMFVRETHRFRGEEEKENGTREIFIKLKKNKGVI